ncbi:MAG: hypothetical protein CVT70_16920 [Alphaproteobacteria bacterium HGW-Alphaproteobacteria-1]|nr:MAG: hypothetical protein CVT70_16920 [Alphaproteobacteria bacterium HGW-Alphaproteobacteria-1]
MTGARRAAVDPRFSRARAQAHTRQRRRVWRRVAVGLGVAVVLVGLGLMSGIVELRAPLPAPSPAAVPPEIALAPEPETGPETAPAPEAPRFIDLPGRPLRIETGRVAQSVAPARLPRPETLPPGRGAGDILVIRDTMIPAGERLSLTLPTSQEDFAIFQAQRSAAARPAAPSSARAGGPVRPRNVAEALALVASGPEASRGMGFGALALRPPERRHPLYDDTVLRIARSTPVEAVLLREGLPPTEAVALAEAAAALLGLEALEGEHVLALRRQAPPPAEAGAARFVQAAFYAPDRYIGALARQPEAPPEAVAERPAIAIASDPWIGRDLAALLDVGPAAAAATATQPRIMDGLYGAALRQGLPARLVGQIIMLLSAAHKLDAEATESDRITLVLSADPVPGGQEAESRALDQVLYIGIDSATAPIRCYVYRPAPDAAPACWGPRDSRSASRVAPGAALDTLGGGEGAVTQLVNRIIQVESGGRADARNPLSTATGLGQFIDSTWLRMMRTYRPDLTAQMSNAELLALRTEPGIAREMVENLAREGAAYLRARGHTITAGRLYLAHFLGMDGAHVALSAAPDADLLSLFGAGVIRANPFLEGRDAGYVVDWAERKMSGTSGRVAVIREPAGLDTFRATVTALLAAE